MKNPIFFWLKIIAFGLHCAVFIALKELQSVLTLDILVEMQKKNVQQI